MSEGIMGGGDQCPQQKSEIRNKLSFLLNSPFETGRGATIGHLRCWEYSHSSFVMRGELQFT